MTKSEYITLLEVKQAECKKWQDEAFTDAAYERLEGKLALLEELLDLALSDHSW